MFVFKPEVFVLNLLEDHENKGEDKHTGSFDCKLLSLFVSNMGISNSEGLGYKFRFL